MTHLHLNLLFLKNVDSLLSKTLVLHLTDRKNTKIEKNR
ncbi:hypothetical protein RC62_4593 [Flavobacterium aquidurense]|uniref:Uncharacterized protein n=1 Tax=Flavobacterium aquidurense TaxID=362413 RepID=A0A0Q0S6M0_9FLAO|nr:hypothetical protein RC62_4593 [Flavobacterium aquidurense]